MQAFLSDYLVQ